MKNQPERESRARAQQQARWLIVARIASILVVVLACGLFLVTLPTYFVYLHNLCTTDACLFGQLHASSLRTLRTLGLSLNGYAILVIIFVIISTLPCVLIAALLLWRASNNWMAMLVAIMLVLLGTSTSTTDASVLRPWLGTVLAAPVANLSDYFGALALPLIFSLFPTGRFVPRWTRWLVLMMLMAAVVFAFGPPAAPPEVSLISTLFWVCCMLVLAGAQVYRYRSISTPVEQQQTKWVIFGFSLALLITVIITLPELFVPSFRQPDSPYEIFSILGLTLFLTLPIALAFGLAILRHRLWDIDAIINKALVYGLLTGLLAAVYAGLIISLAALVGTINAQASQQPVIIVISTLVIAALFQPLRHRIQALIDRRFYRSKYNRAQTLTAFSESLRNEVDLSQLSELLVTVVHETMQPTHVSLWLCPPEGDRKRNPGLTASEARAQ